MTPSPAASPPFWLFALFPIFFVGLWLFVVAILAWLSGWSELAERFPGGPRPMGERLSGQIMRFGRVRENNVTTMIPTTGGLYLYMNPLFRFRRPPVLVPWPRIRYVESGSFLWSKWHVFELADVTQVWVRDGAAPVLRAHGVSIPQPSE